MNEILWDYGYKVKQHFSVEEKIRYFKEYLHYITYTKAYNLTPVEKRTFLSSIDFAFINTMIDEKTSLLTLKQLAGELLSLNPSVLQNKLDDVLLLKDLHDNVHVKTKTFYEFIDPLWKEIKRFCL